jgi:phage tail-like protein
MADSSKDPINAAMFGVDFGGGREGWFMSVSGGGGEVETIMVKESIKDGGVLQRAIPGNFKHTALELKRGLTDSMALWDWFKEVEEGRIAKARVTGSLVAYSQEHKEVARWEIKEAWPSKLGFPQLDAKSNEISVESLTIQHTGMTRTK